MVASLSPDLYNLHLVLETSYSLEKSRFVNPKALIRKDKLCAADTLHKRLGYLGSGHKLQLIRIAWLRVTILLWKVLPI